MRRRHVLVHHRLEIEHVERFLGARNEMVVVARRPDEGIGRPPWKRRFGERRKSRSGEQRARCDKLNKAAATGGAIDTRRHHRILLPDYFIPCILSGNDAIAMLAPNLPSFWNVGATRDA